MVDAVTAFFMAALTSMAGYVSLRMEKIIDRNTQAFIHMSEIIEKRIKK